MSNPIAQTQDHVTSTKKLSTQMCAVLLIFCADPSLMNLLDPFVDLNTETVDWEQIQKIQLSSGHMAAVAWVFNRPFP